jgi:hypothetical protein
MSYSFRTLGNEVSTRYIPYAPPGNVLPRLPLFDGVGSPKFPYPHFLKPWYQIKHDPSSVLPPFCLPYARTFPSPENPTWSHKSQTTTPDSISYLKGLQIVSPIFAFLPDRFRSAMGNLRFFKLFSAALLKPLNYGFFIGKSTKSVVKVYTFSTIWIP